jgi:hypothetical protein
MTFFSELSARPPLLHIILRNNVQNRIFMINSPTSTDIRSEIILVLSP